MARPLSATAARAILDAAELVKAPGWSESRQWRVVSGGRVIVIILPSYSMLGRRNGWTWILAETRHSVTTPPEPTREKAAAAGLAAWQRWATNNPK